MDMVWKIVAALSLVTIDARAATNVRKQIFSGQVSPDGNVVISGGIGDSTLGLSTRLVRKELEESIEVQSGGDVKIYVESGDKVRETTDNDKTKEQSIMDSVDRARTAIDNDGEAMETGDEGAAAEEENMQMQQTAPPPPRYVVLRPYSSMPWYNHNYICSRVNSMTAECRNLNSAQQASCSSQGLVDIPEAHCASAVRAVLSSTPHGTLSAFSLADRSPGCLTNGDRMSYNRHPTGGFHTGTNHGGYQYNAPVCQVPQYVVLRPYSSMPWYNHNYICARVNRYAAGCQYLSSTQQASCSAQGLVDIPEAHCASAVSAVLLNTPHGSLSAYSLTDRSPGCLTNGDNMNYNRHPTGGFHTATNRGGYQYNAPVCQVPTYVVLRPYSSMPWYDHNYICSRVHTAAAECWNLNSAQQASCSSQGLMDILEAHCAFAVRAVLSSTPHGTLSAFSLTDRSPGCLTNGDRMSYNRHPTGGFHTGTNHGGYQYNAPVCQVPQYVVLRPYSSMPWYNHNYICERVNRFAAGCWNLNSTQQASCSAQGLVDIPEAHCASAVRAVLSNAPHGSLSAYSLVDRSPGCLTNGDRISYNRHPTGGFHTATNRGGYQYNAPVCVEATPTTPTFVPTDEPTSAPTDVPTSAPTNVPTDEPTSAPTYEPTDEPTDAPTDEPTNEPTDAPTDDPTDEPTDAPSGEPTDAPTDEPTDEPTSAPTYAPTDGPTDAPTDEPTYEPTDAPTDDPTDVPTDDPTDEPTDSPTDEPTDEPTDAPTYMRTDEPTSAPTAQTTTPTKTPTATPTVMMPTIAPTTAPTMACNRCYNPYGGNDCVSMTNQSQVCNGCLSNPSSWHCPAGCLGHICASELACHQCYFPYHGTQCVSMSNQNHACSRCVRNPSSWHCPAGGCRGNICTSRANF